VWAHAEYLKLLRSALDGKVFDRVDPVYERYCTPEGHKRVRHNVEIFSFRRPIQKIDSGDTLRIIDGERFDLVWSSDNWKTVKSTASRELGSAGFSADIPARSGPGRISWTLKWTDANRWLGYNVTIEIAS
jgi:glucoamylase